MKPLDPVTKYSAFVHFTLSEFCKKIPTLENHPMITFHNEKLEVFFKFTNRAKRG